jgi:hypothetical protein
VRVREWQALRDQVGSRIEAADIGIAVAFAAVTAERVVRLDPRKRPFTWTLRPLLDHVWLAAAGDRDAYKPVAVALGEHYISEYCHNDGQDGPDDADDDPAAAVLYAAECYFHFMPRFAVLVAGRAMDAADDRAQLEADEDDDAEAEAAMTAEARQQLADLDALTPHAVPLARARFGLPAADHERLLAALRGIR